MKIRHDKESGAIYIRLRDGQVADTLELDEGAYLDVDADGYVLGAEFLSLEEMAETADRLGGMMDLPDRVEDPENFHLSPA